MSKHQNNINDSKDTLQSCNQSVTNSLDTALSAALMCSPGRVYLRNLGLMLHDRQSGEEIGQAYLFFDEVKILPGAPDDSLLIEPPTLYHDGFIMRDSTDIREFFAFLKPTSVQYMLPMDTRVAGVQARQGHAIAVAELLPGQLYVCVVTLTDGDTTAAYWLRPGLLCRQMEHGFVSFQVEGALHDTYLERYQRQFGRLAVRNAVLTSVE